MSNLTITEMLKPETVERVILGGDLSRLTSSEKLDYYSKVCVSLGLNPLTQPFAYIKLNGKEVLYAKRDCTDQLRRVHNVSIRITAREHINGVYVVTAQASMPGGRTDESTGAVTVEGLKGDALANAYLKAETKAKRRVTLSICGLGLLDESEVDSIPEATVVEVPKIEPKKDEYRIPEFVSKIHAGKRPEDLDDSDLQYGIDIWTNAALRKGKPAPDGFPGEFVRRAKAELENRARARLSSDWQETDFDSAYDLAKGDGQ